MMTMMNWKSRPLSGGRWRNKIYFRYFEKPALRGAGFLVDVKYVIMFI